MPGHRSHSPRWHSSDTDVSTSGASRSSNLWTRMLSEIAWVSARRTGEYPPGRLLLPRRALLPGLAALTSSTGGLGNGETTVVSYLIPGGTIQAGTTYRIRAFGTFSSTVASNTSHFYIRYGESLPSLEKQPGFSAEVTTP